MSSSLLCHVPGHPGFPETKIVNPRGGGRERKILHYLRPLDGKSEHKKDAALTVTIGFA
jgi:hypothetical protein